MYSKQEMQSREEDNFSLTSALIFNILLKVEVWKLVDASG